MLSEIPSLTALIFDSIGDDAAQAELPRALCQAAKAEVAAVGSASRDGRAQGHYSFGVSNEAFKSYEAKGNASNIFINKSISLGLIGVCSSEKYISDEEVLCSDFYADFLKPNGELSKCLGFSSTAGKTGLLLCGLHRNVRQPHFEAEVIAGMKTLGPLMVHAVEARRRAADSRGRLAAALADSAMEAAFVVTGERRVRLANRAAEAVLAAGWPLKMDAACLTPAAANAAVGFRTAVRWACSGRGGQVLALPGGETQDGAPPRFYLSVDSLGGTDTNLASIRLRDRETCLTRNLDWASDAYAFSPAERHLAEALMRGATAAHYAERQALRMPTVRTHLASLYAKTSTPGHAQLVLALWSALGH